MEDCCKPNEDEDISIKGGKATMDIKKIILWVIIALLAIAVIYVVFIRPSSGGSVISAGRAAGQVARSSGGMVGGC